MNTFWLIVFWVSFVGFGLTLGKMIVDWVREGWECLLEAAPED